MSLLQKSAEKKYLTNFGISEIERIDQVIYGLYGLINEDIKTWEGSV